MDSTTPTFAMEAAFDALREGKDLNGKNGMQTPRDRAGAFELQLIKKHLPPLTGEIGRKVLDLPAVMRSGTSRNKSLPKDAKGVRVHDDAPCVQGDSAHEHRRQT